MQVRNVEVAVLVVAMTMAFTPTAWAGGTAWGPRGGSVTWSGPNRCCSAGAVAAGVAVGATLGAAAVAASRPVYPPPAVVVAAPPVVYAPPPVIVAPPVAYAPPPAVVVRPGYYYVR